MKKPLLYLPYDAIAQIHTSRAGQTRTFDLAVECVDGTKHVFAMMAR